MSRFILLFLTSVLYAAPAESQFPWSQQMLQTNTRAVCMAFTLFASSLRISRAEGMPDVLVYGGTSGGISTAVSAAKAGMKVTLVEPTSRIGGLMSCGLSYSDFRSFESLSGFFQEFANRVQQHYVETY